MANNNEGAASVTRFLEHKQTVRPCQEAAVVGAAVISVAVVVSVHVV